MGRAVGCWGGLAYILGLGVTLQVRLDGLVLLVEIRQVGNQVLDDVGVRQRVDARLLPRVGRDTACVSMLAAPSCHRPDTPGFKHTQASQGVDTVNVHRTATADTLSAASPEGQGGVHLVLYPDERIEHHGPGLVQIQLVGLHGGLLGGLVGVPAVDMELLDARVLGHVGVLIRRGLGLGDGLGAGIAGLSDGVDGGIGASEDGGAEQRPRGCDEARGRAKSGHGGFVDRGSKLAGAGIKPRPESRARGNRNGRR